MNKKMDKRRLLIKQEILISAIRAQNDDHPISYMLCELERINKSDLNKVIK